MTGVGVHLSEIAVEVDNLAARVEGRGVTHADRIALVPGHRHLQIAVEYLNDVLGAVYEADEQELRRSIATDAERADLAARAAYDRLRGASS